jgi:hypothetical protein
MNSYASLLNKTKTLVFPRFSWRKKRRETHHSHWYLSNRRCQWFAHVFASRWSSAFYYNMFFVFFVIGCFWYTFILKKSQISALFLKALPYLFRCLYKITYNIPSSLHWSSPFNFDHHFTKTGSRKKGKSCTEIDYKKKLKKMTKWNYQNRH